jgi:hypothetical protein
MLAKACSVAPWAQWKKSRRCGPAALAFLMWPYVLAKAVGDYIGLRDGRVHPEPIQI